MFFGTCFVHDLLTSTLCRNIPEEREVHTTLVHVHLPSQTAHRWIVASHLNLSQWRLICHAFLSTYVANRVETFYCVFVGNANCMDAVFTSSTVYQKAFLLLAVRPFHRVHLTPVCLLSFSGVRQHNAHCMSSYLPPQTLRYPIVFCY